MIENKILPKCATCGRSLYTRHQQCLTCKAKEFPHKCPTCNGVTWKQDEPCSRCFWPKDTGVCDLCGTQCLKYKVDSELTCESTKDDYARLQHVRYRQRRTREREQANEQHMAERTEIRLARKAEKEKSRHREVSRELAVMYRHHDEIPTPRGKARAITQMTQGRHGDEQGTSGQQCELCRSDTGVNDWTVRLGSNDWNGADGAHHIDHTYYCFHNTCGEGLQPAQVNALRKKFNEANSDWNRPEFLVES